MPKHYIRYGTAAEQKYLIDYKDKYDAVIVNASIMAHLSKSLPTFLNTKIMEKDFIIDPMTHAFQHDLKFITNDKGEIKTSIKKLIDHYGSPVSDIISDHSQRSLKPDDFKGYEDGFTKRVLDFQNQFITDHLSSEYKEYLEEYKLCKTSKYSVAPSFYLTDSNFDEWLEVCRLLLEKSLQLKSEYDNKDVYAQIIMKKNILLDTKKIDMIIDAFSNADGFLYWVDDLKETEATTEELTSLVSFVNKLYEKTNSCKKIIASYGGFFSQLLLKKYLHGFSHGLGYGEAREVVPVGGGIPVAKFYMPSLHHRLLSFEMLNIIATEKIETVNQFHSVICGCNQCKITIKDSVGDFYKYIDSISQQVSYRKSGITRTVDRPTSDSKDLCVRHYIETKHKELNTILNPKYSLESLINMLKTSSKKYNYYLDGRKINYINNWITVLNEQI